MRRIAWLLGFAVGCGPLVVPMAARLSGDDQRRVDRGWEKALAPIDRLSRDEWLDLLIGESLFEEGVDRLYLRSEKNVPGGLVVMEVRFDRTDATQDVFTMEVQRPPGTVARRETYSRADVEQAARALFRQDALEDAGAKEVRDRRWASIRRYFPPHERADAAAD